MRRAIIAAWLAACACASAGSLYWTGGYRRPAATAGYTYQTDTNAYRAYWRMQSTNTLGTPDSVGTYDATSSPSVVGGPALVSIGTNNGQAAFAYQFDAADDYFRVPTGALVGVSGTIGAWVALKSIPGASEYPSVFAFAANSGGDPEIGVEFLRGAQATTCVVRTFGYRASAYQWNMNGARVFTNFADGAFTGNAAWVQCVLTWTNNSAILYLDGKQEAIDTSCSFVNFAPAYQSAIGARLFDSVRLWYGRISGCWISPYAWSSNSVYQHYLYSNPTNYQYAR
jgi:hypothetical protein